MKVKRVRKLRKQHPFAMVSKLTGSALLLLLPVVQQILYRPQSVLEVIGTMGFSALYAVFIIAGAVIFYNTCRYSYTGGEVYLERGVVVKRRFSISYENVSTVTVERNIFAAMFGAAKLSFDTPAGLAKTRDISLYLRRKRVERLVKRLLDGLEIKYEYIADNFRMLLMSALWSNPMTGLLLLVPLIERTGDVIGREFNNAVIESVDFRVTLVSVGITPAAATIANLLVLGWAAALVFQFFRYARFSSRRMGEYIAITRGIGSKNERYTKAHEISALTINRTLSMAIFRLTGIGIFSIGSGKDKGDKSLIAIAANKHELKGAVEGLTDFDTHYDKELRPNRTRLFSYIVIPLIVTVMVLALVSLLVFVPLLGELYFTALLISLVPLGWWTAFRIFAFRHASFGYNGTCAILCGYRRLSLIKYIIPYEHIQFIEISQNIFQKRSGYCNVCVYMYYEQRATHTVKQVKLSDAEEIVKQIENRIAKK